MQIQSIDNSKSDVKFKSNNSIEKASTFVNMNDSQLRELASTISYSQNDNKRHKKSLLSTFYAIPIVDTLASAILVDKASVVSKDYAQLMREEPLSSRVRAATITAGHWGLILLAVGAYNVVKKVIGSQSPGFEKFERDNPIQSFILDAGAIIGGLALGGYGLLKFGNKIGNKNPELGVRAQVKIEKFKNLLDKTKFNTEILPKMAKGAAKLAEKAPWVTTAGRFALANSIWILLGASILKSVQNSKKEHAKIEKNYQTLKNAQFETAKHLNNALEVERVILAQNQKKMAQALRNEMSKTKAPKPEESTEL